MFLKNSLSVYDPVRSLKNSKQFGVRKNILSINLKTANFKHFRWLYPIATGFQTRKWYSKIGFTNVE